MNDNMKEDIFSKIEQLHNEDKHKNIIKLIEKQKAPLNYELVCLLARAYYNMPAISDNDNKYIKKALSLLLSVKDIGENDPLWHYRIGFGYFYTDKEKEALYHFNSAVKLIPKTKENADKWRDFNMDYFINACEYIIKAKEIDKKFGNGKNASEKDILDFILFNMLHKTLPQEDIVTENSIYIPEWMLVIKPVIISFEYDAIEKYDKIEIEWNITCPVFDSGIKEETFGAGKNLKEAIFMAVGEFTTSLLQAIKNTLSNDTDKFVYSSNFNKNNHKWDVYYNPLSVLREEVQSGQINDLFLWEQIQVALHKYLGNQKSVCIKINVTKFPDSTTYECCIDNIYISELTDIINDYINNSIISDEFYTINIKQYFILVQHENTILPYKYEGKEGYIELKNKVKKICSIIYDLESLEEEQYEDMEDAFYNLVTRLDDEVNDFTLCIETLMFVPEIFASNVYDNIAFPESIVVCMQDEEPITIYYTQFSDYSKIYKAIWEIFDNYEDTKMRDITYNKFISMSFSINTILSEGKRIEDLEDEQEVSTPIFEINTDERFEIR